jgi:polyhydroxyalkanoate synthesis regulator protein
MNKAHIDMVQKTFDQNVAMVNQFMDGLNKFAYAGTEAKKDEKDAEGVENAENAE